MQKVAGRPTVFYHRVANNTTYPVIAVPGSAEMIEQDGSYTLTSTQSRQFLVPIADIGGLPPGPDDYLTEIIGDVTSRYDLAAEPGVKPWRYYGPAREWVRCHTKLVGETSPTTTEEPTTEEPE